MPNHPALRMSILHEVFRTYEKALEAASDAAYGMSVPTLYATVEGQLQLLEVLKADLVGAQEEDGSTVTDEEEDGT